MSFVDEPRYDWNLPEARVLRQLLVRIYPQPHEARVAVAGLVAEGVDRRQAAASYWHDVLESAARAGQLRALLERLQEDPALGAFHADIAEALAPGAPVLAAPPADLGDPAGDVALGSPFYLRRIADGEAERELDRDAVSTPGQKPGVVHLLGPREFGKSSLLLRLVDRARGAGARIVRVRLSELPREAVSDLGPLLAALLEALLDETGGDPELAERVAASPAPARAATRLLRREVLDRLDGRGLLLAIDDADLPVARGAPSAHDFLVLLRNWHNESAIEPVWRRLRLALCFRTDATMTADPAVASPLENVGRKCRLAPFGGKQTAELRGLHGVGEDDAPLVELQEWLGGHPALLRRSLHALAEGSTTWPALLTAAREHAGPLGSHLRRHQRHFDEHPEHAAAFAAALAGRPCSPAAARALDGLGLVRSASRPEPACRLYREALRVGSR